MGGATPLGLRPAAPLVRVLLPDAGFLIFDRAMTPGVVEVPRSGVTTGGGDSVAASAEGAGESERPVIVATVPRTANREVPLCTLM